MPTPPPDLPTDLVIPLDELPAVTVDDNGWVLAQDPKLGAVNVGHIENPADDAWRAALRWLAYAVRLAPTTFSGEVMDVRRALDILTGVRPSTREEKARARRLVAHERASGSLLHIAAAAPAVPPT